MTITPITPRSEAPRDRNFVLRVSAEEQQMIRSAAKFVGISASDFVRIAVDERIAGLRK